MQLDPRTPNRLIQASRRFEKIEHHFAAFKATLEWFKSPQCPLKQITVEVGDEARVVMVSLGTTKVVLRLLLVLPEDGIARGQVVCTRAQPKLSVVDPVVTSFSFDAQGRTSFAVDANEDPPEMGQHAAEIVMHVIEMAARPIELPIN